jgi:M6 family metalloprotease-like protein
MRGASRSLCLCLALLVAQSGWAVGPLKPGDYPHPPKDHIHHASAAQIHAAGTLKAATIANALGTKNVAVIIVGFPAGCAGCTSGQHTIQSLATIDTYFTSMASYYDEVSYHQIALAFKFFGPNTGTAGGDATAAVAGAYLFNGAGGTPNHPMEYYGCGDEGPGSSGQASCNGVLTPQGIYSPNSTLVNGNYLIRDALSTARAGHANLDNTHFDEVIVVHAGNGNETTSGTNGDIWSIFYSQDPVISSAGAGFDEGDVVPEAELGPLVVSPLGVMCHEFGHSLGLPDLYNTIFGSSVVGFWEIMDFGPYDDAGRHPSHMSAWDKMTLGWVTPTVAVSKQNTSLTPVETNKSMLKIPVQNGSAQEYFLVEYRFRASGATYDTFIPGDGLLVWHIDDGLTSTRGINATNPNDQNTVNSGSPHYGVSIVPADGIAVSSNHGDANNPYGNGHNFTSPSSDNFAAQPSGISIVNIAGVGTVTVTAQVANLATSAGQSISKLASYPNPAGKGYAHPNGEGHTTLQMQLTRPANDFSFNIYTLSGDLVRKVGSSEITLNLDRSGDNKWVYEFVWDLKNGDGQMVAPGVYLYLARADGKSQSNKAVIIR